MFTILYVSLRIQMETTLDNSKFATRLQKIMEDQELTASAFAEKMDIGRATISHLMAGRNKPSLDFVMKVISTFPEIDLYWLLYGKKSDHKRVDIMQSYSAALPEKKAQKKELKTSEIDLPFSSENTAIKSQTSSPVSDHPMHKISSSGSPIKRIIIFKEDGTFESYEG